MVIAASWTAVIVSPASLLVATTSASTSAARLH